jgi:hypothetical protein
MAIANKAAVTVTLDLDVISELRRLGQAKNNSLSSIVNEKLRAGIPTLRTENAGQ